VIDHTYIVPDIVLGIDGIFKCYQHGGYPAQENNACDINEDMLQAEQGEEQAGIMVEKPHIVDPPDGDDNGLRNTEGMKFLGEACYCQDGKEHDERKMLGDPVGAEPFDLFFAVSHVFRCHMDASVTCWQGIAKGAEKCGTKSRQS
jgi:hypothetical protein